MGEVTAVLNRNKLTENTAVIVSSPDEFNLHCDLIGLLQGVIRQNILNLKGRKESTLEGGMREPTVIRWLG